MNGKILKKCTCPNQGRCTHAWTFRYWLNGKQVEESYHDTIAGNGKTRYGSGKKLAEDAQLKLAHDKRSGEAVFIDRKLADVKFVDYCQQWIDRRPNKQTRTRYQNVLNHHMQFVEGRTLRQVAQDREGAQKALDAADGAAANLIRVLLASPCKEAVDAGRLPSHRLRGLTIPAKSAKAKFEFASRQQIEIMATELGERGILAYLMRGCGLRLGEAHSVSKADFRDDGTVLRLWRQRLPDGELAPLKARGEDDYRDVPVPSYVWNHVKNMPDGFLVAKERRWPIQRAFTAAAKKAGMPEDFVPHWLRHMFASVALTNGVPITDVSHWLGHKDINITFATYGHLVPSSFTRARLILDQDWEETST